MQETNVRVLFFASLRERLNRPEIAVSLQGSLTLSELKRKVAAMVSEAEDILFESTVMCAVNQAMVNPEADVLVQAGDEVAFFPPVTGG